ncbi:DUF3440 domain-containing protein [Micromonospora sp. WMMC273]|uniref:DUF3440 domain-containing protein n=1 Tax=Micromonospora sp. WMMC273 TaxID=3015157 RepID=UPI0022B62A15|nr:DUF3440 domain-containing protein [Micromonospora sp. WMMC273]MCZ7478808.1 phosphoadenosine phosphosulfate reductase family protein [Micromonospora sp. WMMC273]MCZ7478936.1 phosphoadenosine phosphosulfate reductase family protein [Micromonospora sp. WMMC273]MCZ7478997.1 phosphoadenosine phosphosulfate reductase family protein [Micromonospora sp. WMMC273]
MPASPARVDPGDIKNKKRQSRDRIDVDRSVYDLACERMEVIFDLHDTVMIAFSGGKDSTAVLNVALQVAHSHPRHARHLPLRTYFYDEEAIPYETEEYVRRVSQRDDVDLTWYCVPFKHRNACSRTSPWWWPWAPEAEALWCRPMPPEAVTTLPGFPIWPPEARLTAPDANGLIAPPSLGNVAMVMGIRAQESLTRYRALVRAGGREHNYLIKFDDATAKGNLWKAYPIYDWRTEDVWTAPALMGWDYNRAYDRLEMAGLGHSAQRCSPAFGEEPLEKLHTYASCFPEVWAKMVDRVPGVGAAGRYARTELYGYRGRPEKPAGMTWPQFITHYVGKFRPGDQKFVASRLRDEILLHYRKTTTPITRKTRHPVTGISWEWLLMLAMRGDFKGRKQAGNESSAYGSPEWARLWHKYIDELASTIADGLLPDLAHPGTVPEDLYVLLPAELRDGSS